MPYFELIPFEMPEAQLDITPIFRGGSFNIVPAVVPQL